MKRAFKNLQDKQRMNKFHGTGVAMVTPFNTDGSVDLEGLKRLINFQIDGGVQYLVSLGTTGEASTLSKEENCLGIYPGYSSGTCAFGCRNWREQHLGRNQGFGEL